MSEEEQRYGQGSFEQAQGFKEMPTANPDPDPEPAMTDREFAHFNRPPEADFGELTERSYVDFTDTGRRRDERETVEADRAAEDLTAIRKAERDARERELNEATAAAVDSLRQQVQDPTGQPQQQLQPQAEQRPDPNLELQPDEIQYQQEQAAVAQADKAIEEVLKDPWVRQRIETEFNGVKAQAAAEVEQAKTAYTQAVQQNALVGLAVLNSAFPELAGLNPEQVNGALRVMRPERAEQYRQHVRQVSALAENYQRQEAALQQQRQGVQLQQYYQAQETFNRFAAEQDARVLTNDPPETVAAIRNGILAEAKAAGISEKELLHVYNTNSAMRHSFVQNLIADGMRYRLAQRSVAQHRANPIPQVQRPGVSQPHSSDDGAYAAIERQFRGKDLNAKQAAALLIARRSARS